MKILMTNFLLIAALSCLSLTAFGQNDALKTVSKSEYDAVKNELAVLKKKLAECTSTKKD